MDSDYLIKATYISSSPFYERRLDYSPTFKGEPRINFEAVERNPPPGFYLITNRKIHSNYPIREISLSIVQVFTENSAFHPLQYFEFTIQDFRFTRTPLSLKEIDKRIVEYLHEFWDLTGSVSPPIDKNISNITKLIESLDEIPQTSFLLLLKSYMSMYTSRTYFKDIYKRSKRSNLFDQFEQQDGIREFLSRYIDHYNELT